MTLYGTWLSLKHLSSPPPHLDAPFSLFPVSVLKPLKGVEDGIEENLRSFFLLDYPVFELIFSISDPEDPVRPIVERFMRKYPSVSARLIVGDVDVGPNPKVNNMVRSYQQARYDWLLISDSNVRVPENYIRRLTAHLDAGVGLVTAIVAGKSPDGFGAHLEAVYLNTFYARGMLLAAKVGRPCVIGKSMLFRRSVANRFGGIKILAKYLAEDFMAGEAMRMLGFRVVIASDPVHQQIGKYSVRAFLMRHLRWGRIRKAQAPLTFLIEPWFGSLVSGFLGAWAFQNIGVLPGSLFLALHFLVWSSCDFLLMKKMGSDLDFFTPAAWFTREISAVPLWFCIALNNTVNWRGRRLKVQPGGILEAT